MDQSSKRWATVCRKNENLACSSIPCSQAVVDCDAAKPTAASGRAKLGANKARYNRPTTSQA